MSTAQATVRSKISEFKTHLIYVAIVALTIPTVIFRPSLMGKWQEVIYDFAIFRSTRFIDPMALVPMWIIVFVAVLMPVIHFTDMSKHRWMKLYLVGYTWLWVSTNIRYNLLWHRADLLLPSDFYWHWMLRILGG